MHPLQLLGMAPSLAKIDIGDKASVFEAATKLGVSDDHLPVVGAIASIARRVGHESVIDVLGDPDVSPLLSLITDLKKPAAPRGLYCKNCGEFNLISE